MRKLTEKIIIISLCLYNSYRINPELNLAFYFLISLIFSFTLDLVQYKNIRGIIHLIFIALCIYDASFTYYLPLILYNLYLDFKLLLLLTVPFIFIHFSLLNLFIAIISVYMSITFHSDKLFTKENRIMRDRLREDTLYLRRYNKQLKIDREKNIQIAILSERNRIARELHDSIGHAISSSILQVVALKVSADNETRKSLNQLQETLNHGMNDIRDSIHNLHKNSLDLKHKVEELLDELHTINTKLIYQMEEELPYSLKFDILSMIKEGITNCMKHANATELKISIISQPKFYTIVIEDNGDKYHDEPTKDGIGLMSMNEIASKYKGFLNYKFDKGFKIHITLMKG